MPQHHFREDVEQNPGFSQAVGVKHGPVWKVIDSYNGKLVTTSGRLNTTTLDDTVTQVIAGFSLRKADYIVTQWGVVVAIIHPDDTWETEP